MREKLTGTATLATVRMVEDVLRHAEDTIKMAELKRRLPKQVNHNTLKHILEYLEESHKIDVSVHGITWIHVPKHHTVPRVEHTYIG